MQSQNFVQQPNALLTAALGYAAKGCRVFPCHSMRDGKCSCPAGPSCGSPAKHPRTTDGFKSATTDPAHITSWWTSWPDANIGLRTGDGLTVIDVDEGRDGNESLEQCMIEHGKLPETLTVLTGGGGFHYYFRGEAATGVDRLGRGVDIRSDGGYVIAPPSNHASGRSYLVEATSPDTMADLPAWVTQLAGSSKKRVSGNSGDRSHYGGIDAHGFIGAARDNAMTSLAGSMRRRAMGFDEIFAALRVTNAQRCLPPLDEATVAKCVRSICKHAPHEVPRGHIPTGDPNEDWKALLVVKQKRDGTIEYTPCLANVMLILRNDPTWRDVLSWDEFAETITTSGSPWDKSGLWTEEDTSELRSWLHLRDQAKYMIDIGDGEVESAVRVVAKKHVTHPVREWLRTLEWDKKPRVERALTEYFGSPDNEYVRGVSRRWFVSAIARVMRPGCKVDTTLVLEGDQGLGKSTALRTLAGDEWFFDSKLKIGDKDAYQAERARWIIEIGELAALYKSDQETIKSYLVERAPTYRGSYERRASSHPRHCVFVGTTNADEYFEDTTGNRRFWPVICRLINEAGLRQDRDQLWAEAMDMFDKGATWWVDTPEFADLCKAEQELRMRTDAWESLLRDWLRGKTDVTAADALMHGLLIEKGKITRADQVRVGAALRRLGWVRQQVRSASGDREWRFRRHQPS